MGSSVTITLKSGSDLTVEEIADCYSLINRTGFLMQTGVLESKHLVHNPTMILAHQNGRLVGIQAYSLFQLPTPFRRKEMAFIFGGLAYQDARIAKKGMARRMAKSYFRHILGPFWAFRDYAILTGTVNPRLIQFMGIQHHLYLAFDNTLTPSLFNFVHEFLRQYRPNNPYPISDQLVVFPSGGLLSRSDISQQWPLMYRASQEKFNKLAYDLQLIERVADRHYLTGNFLWVLGRSSRHQLLKGSWKLATWWLRKHLGLKANSEPTALPQ
ncbi:hypothetical protein ACFQ4C_20935 [Larkinella insperata]|uniref:GNAT family N-acetyltransferase n=1 Tax=Larkinella insperata TaxID=332158 RepID=A0ABW3QCV4_9BACT